MRSPAPTTRETRDFASELKFVVDPATAGQIRAWARPRLLADPHASGPDGDDYRTTTIYYDTQDFAVYHRRGSYGRSKFRIRRYGTADMVFFERKLRASGVVSKRRTIVPVDQMSRLSEPAADKEWHGYWFHQRILTRRLLPVCQVTYRRMARVSMTDYGPMRLTLDDELIARPIEAPGGAEGAGAPMLPGRMILEMKFRVEMPAVFRRLAETFALQPVRLSKYRLAAEALGRVQPVANATSPRAGAPRA
jgi:hypothetical protein